MTFREVSKRWIRQKAVDISFNTYEMYRDKLKQIDIEFGDREISDITSVEIQNYITNLFLHKNFAKSTLQKYKITLNQVFNYAIFHEFHTSNPVAVVRLPKKANVSKVSSADEVIVLSILQNKDIQFGFYPFFLLFSGLRPSEALAVEWTNIDFINSKITVNKAVRFKGNNPMITAGLKNGELFRQACIPKILIDELLARKKSKGLVFENEDSTPLTKSQLSKRWKKYLNTTGIECSQYQLRHNFASNVYNAGVDIKTGQKLMGHKDISVTLKTYTDLSKQFETTNIDKLNNFIETKYNKPKDTI